ncbi:MAG: hypothetical protein KKD18_00015 [Nanoarchaeota archaeon]|nr:hypothetical protein [Nanoarchaeota archaeon]
MAFDQICIDRGRIKVAYLCETSELKVIRIENGIVLYKEVIPELTVGEFCALVDKYDKICNSKT